MSEYEREKVFSEIPPEGKVLHLINNSWASLEYLLKDDVEEEKRQEVIDFLLEDKINGLRQIEGISDPNLQEKVNEFCDLVEQYVTNLSEVKVNKLVDILNEINVLITGRGVNIEQFN